MIAIVNYEMHQLKIYIECIYLTLKTRNNKTYLNNFQTHRRQIIIQNNWDKKI